MLRKSLSGLLFAGAALMLMSAFPAVESKAADDKETLAKILAAQPDKVKQRYEYRHPMETLNFCEVSPGETVIETLPGRGWYSGILYPYLGENGKLIGANYPGALVELTDWSDELRERILAGWRKWPSKIKAESVAKGGELESHAMTEIPERFSGVADTVLFIRSLHNLNRFGPEKGFFQAAIAEAFRNLKPGGIACVVQHRAPDSASDAWASGSKGYLKTSFVMEAFQKAGFKFVAASEINANPKDKPTEADYVWRLLPSLRGLDDEAKIEANKKIGESDRMTLKFVKPSS